MISNVNLYKRCSCEPLSVRVERSRWRMLGHVLRGPVNGPAYTSLLFAVNSLQMPGRVGRPQTDPSSLIKLDLSDRNLFLNNVNDLDYLRNVDFDRAAWRRMQTA